MRGQVLDSSRSLGMTGLRGVSDYSLKWFSMGLILRACRPVGPGEGHDMGDLIEILGVV